MKTIFKALIFSAAAFACLESCQKSSSSGNSKAQVSLSKSNVKLGEPLFASASNAPGNSLIKWTVNPPDHAYVSTVNGQSVILFSTPGNYTITASFFTDSATGTAYDSTSSTVMVTDSIFTDTTAHCNNYVNAAINPDDLITLVPVSMSDTGGVVLLAHTRDLYPHSPYINDTFTYSPEGSYGFALTGIIESPCATTGNVPAPATAFLPVGSAQNGTYGISISVNGTTYSGTLNVSATAYNFTWPYTSGVVIAPLQLNR